MNPIDNIMALAERLQDEAWNDGKSGVALASERTVAAFDALQAAIEQALKPGEAVKCKHGVDDGACKECYHETAAPQPQPNATVPALNDADSVDCPRCGHCCPDDTALLMECIGLLMQMPIKHPQQGEYRDDLIRRIRERLK
jgi:hypothetical protein